MNERQKKLLETMKQFNKDNKSEVLSFGDEAEDKAVISTGLLTIDKFIGGGTKRGTFTVIYGGQSVGKSTLVLQTIANAQKNGLIACYIDLEHTFDKTRAISLGVNLQELVLAEKCENAEQALEIIRKLCKEKVIDLIVVDSVQAMSPINEQENKGKERELASKEIAELARTLSKFFRVVSPDVFNAQASVIMIGQVRIAGIGSFYTHADMTGGEAIRHWAFTRLFIRRGQKSDSPSTKSKCYFLDPDKKIRFATQTVEIGFDTVFKLEKTKSSTSSKENSEIHMPFLYDKGFVDEVITSDEMPIEIEAITEEDKQIIEAYLKDKNTQSSSEEVNTLPESSETPIETSLEPKKKRGRPKKT
jgi:protein RecA